MPMKAPKGTRNEAAFLAPYVAAEIIMGSADKFHSDPLQSFITMIVDAHNSPDALRTVLCRIGVCASKSVLHRKHNEDIAAGRDFKADFDPWGLLILAFGNLGFKKKGANAGCVARCAGYRRRRAVCRSLAPLDL